MNTDEQIIEEVQDEDMNALDAIGVMLEAVADEDFDTTDTESLNAMAAGLRDILFQIVDGTYRTLSVRHDEFKAEVKRAKAASRKRERDLKDTTISKEFRKALEAEVKRNQDIIGSTPAAWLDLKAIEKAARALIRPE